MTTQPSLEVYEMSLNLIVEWQAHSLSNSGSQQSNRTLPRQQVLADGSEVDAISGNISKQRHASILREYLLGYDEHLCSACMAGDARRATAASELGATPSMEQILRCGLCDTHGFLTTGKKGANGSMERLRRYKGTIIDFSMALAIPDHYGISQQTFTRRGIGNDEEGDDGQMIFKTPSRSGQYAMIVRYTGASVGMDSESRRLVIADEKVRLSRHKAILLALRDQMLSPSGATTAKLLPHITGLHGAVIVRNQPGRVPMYSPLQPNFTDILDSLCEQQHESCSMYKFDSIVGFSQCIGNLAATSKPYMSRRHPSTRESQ